MSRELKVKSILITQSLPENGKSVYDDMVKKYKIKLDFRSFIHVEPLTPREIRNQKVGILDHTAVVLNSKNAVDNFFRVAQSMRIEVPIDMKYFCVNESISNYVQKYIVLRKRKMFHGKGTEKDFFALCKHHSSEKFLFPCSDIRRSNIPDFFASQNLHFSECIMYRTVSSDLSDLENVFYDILVFFSPADIKSLFDNFPHFSQNNTRIAGFGETTKKAILDANLILDIEAPSPENPSMVSALESYIKKANS